MPGSAARLGFVRRATPFEALQRAGLPFERSPAVAFCVLWTTGPDPATDRAFRLTAMRPEGEGWALFDRFCGDLFGIVERLAAAGIAHSDIWEPNVIVRDQRPVLIDFGWGRRYGEPPARDNFHQPDDAQAMRQMLLRLGALRRMVKPDLEAKEPGAGSV